MRTNKRMERGVRKEKREGEHFFLPTMLNRAARELSGVPVS